MCNRKQDVHDCACHKWFSKNIQHESCVSFCLRIALTSSGSVNCSRLSLVASLSRRLSQVSFDTLDLCRISLDMQRWNRMKTWNDEMQSALTNWTQMSAEESNTWTKFTEQQTTKNWALLSAWSLRTHLLSSSSTVSSSGLSVFMPLSFCQICLLHQQRHVSGHNTKAAATSRHCQASSLESSWII